MTSLSDVSVASRVAGDDEGVGLDELVKGAIERDRAKHEEFKLISSKPAKLGGQAAHEVVFSGKRGTLAKKCRMLMAVRPGGNVYQVTYTASPDGFAEHEQAADGLIRSFEFLPD